MQIQCVPRPLRDARADLKAAKEYLRQYTYEILARLPSRCPGDARDKPHQQISPWDSDQGRGMVLHGPKSRAAVNYTLSGVEPHGSTRGVRPMATVAKHSQSYLVTSNI